MGRFPDEEFSASPLNAAISDIRFYRTDMPAECYDARSGELHSASPYYDECTDPCQNVNCQNGGTCSDGLCDCPVEWQGTLCETKSCHGVDCKNGGTCTEGVCNCPAEWTGNKCQTRTCHGINCQHGGSCSEGICSCPAEWEGTVRSRREGNTIFKIQFPLKTGILDCTVGYARPGLAME